MLIKRGSIVLVNLGKASGSVQAGIRPMVVIQNDIGNTYSPTFIGVPITSKKNKRKLITHKVLEGYEQLVNDSTVIAEQILTVNKTQIVKYICNLKEKDIIDINKKIAISLAL